MSLLVAEGVTRKFGGLTAVDTLDLAVAPGSIHALIGPNGAGKSTMLNMLSGIIAPSSGRITFDGRRIDLLKPSAIGGLGVGRTFQVPRLFRGLSLAQNVMVGAHCRRTAGFGEALFGLPRARRQERAMAEQARETLAVVGLEAYADRPAASATFVQQRLVEIARALVLPPSLLLLDEPAAGMNAVEIEQLAALLRRLRERGITILFIEHHMRLVMGIAERITVLDFGRKIAEGTPEAVRTDPAVLTAYLGERFQHAPV